MKDYNHATLYYYNWLKRETLSVDHALRVISLYESALNGMRNYLVGSVAKFDIFLIIVSIILSLQVCIISMSNIYFLKSTIILLLFSNYYYIDS